MDWTAIPGILELLTEPDAPDEQVIEAYRGLCVKCYGPANSVHELVPRSLAMVVGKSPFGFRNRVTLCALCHDQAQTGPIEQALNLRRLADRLLQMFGGIETTGVLDRPTGDG